MIRKLFLAAALIAWLVLCVLSMTSCAARTNYAKVPTEIPCGREVPFIDASGHQSTWIFPCWPENSQPKCVAGCDHP